MIDSEWYRQAPTAVELPNKSHTKQFIAIKCREWDKSGGRECSRNLLGEDPIKAISRQAEKWV